MKKLLYSALTLCLSILTTATLQAADWTDKIAINGFASANYHQTDDAAPFNGEEGDGHDNQGS